MTPAARIQMTADVLEKIGLSRIPMDSTIGDFMRVHRFIGAKDRAEIAERLYNLTRAWARLGWWLERLGLEDTPRLRVLLWLCLGENLDVKRLHQLYDGSRYGPPSLSAEEENAAAALQGETLTHSAMPEAVQVECPALYESSLRSYFGDAFMAEMEALLSAATLDLRVNTFLAPREKVHAYLEADGVKTALTPYSPWGLRAEGKAFLSRTKAFSKGWVEIQDEGSQLIAAVCHAEPGMQVLDYCAGAGGKTLALGAAMQRKGRIVAMDTDAKRLEKGRLRFRKAHLSDIIEIRPLEEDRNRKWLRRQKATFDIALADVPCTGTGTWRRNPDMRWRVYGPPLEELVTVQAEILDRLAATVKPGGRLVYATCSLLPEENENQIAAFLQRHPDYTASPHGLDPALGKPYMRLTPLRHTTDGFFAAVLRRSAV